jgi:hypothetical protein
MQQSPNEPSPKPASQDVEQPDGKVVRFTPRPRPKPERRPEPPMPDDDPGPGAA